MLSRLISRVQLSKLHKEYAAQSGLTNLAGLPTLYYVTCKPLLRRENAVNLQPPARAFTQTTAKKYAKKEPSFEYVWEKKIPSIFLSGDKEELTPLDTSKPIRDFENSRELESADEVVRKLLSLEFARRQEMKKQWQKELLERVQRNIFDESSPEAKIALMTANIRNLQVHCKSPGGIKDQRARVILKETIDKRQKQLKNLRLVDYLRFEWLLEVLNISYKMPPMFQHWQTRKGTLRVMVREFSNKTRKDRIEEYRSKLKFQQAEFLKKKEETLEWIAQEEKELGVLASDTKAHIAR